MRWINRIAAALLGLSLAACGGGGGDAGAPPFGGGGGGGGSETYAISVDVQRAGASTNQISSSETVQAVAVVRTTGGDPVQGVVVTFTESGASLVEFAPTVGTALTDANGVARVDLSATAPSGTGATTIRASATVDEVSVSQSAAIQITAASAPGGAMPVPAAVNFVGSAPSGVAIVIKGAGGSGRSESAILTFKVVDAQNAPINGAPVAFSINSNSGGASIQPSSATTDSNGIATTTVSSGSMPASVVLTATTTGAGGALVSTQSDTLIVSNSVPIQAGFEIVAAKYNLDGNFTGDSTTITAFVRDQFGNPVADGVAVNFTTDYGVVARSTLGGCTTLNGRCDVEFAVQDPRGSGLATVVAQIRVGDSTTLVDQLQINMAGAVSDYLAVELDGVTPLTTLTLTSCKQSFELRLSDGSGRAAAAGTAIATGFVSTGVAVSVTSGNPVLDQLSAGYPPTLFSVEVDVTSASLAPKCVPTGMVGLAPGYFRLKFTTPKGITFEQRVNLRYPQ